MTTRRRFKLFSRLDSTNDYDSQESPITRIATEINLSYYNNKSPTLPLNDDKTLSIILDILTKKSRSSNELLILQCMLESFDSFIHSLKCEETFKDILTNIALVLTYEESLGNTLLFRFGDTGDKFYIILKGSVSVMIPKEYTVLFDYVSYVKYLVYLFYIKEKELLLNVILTNRDGI